MPILMQGVYHRSLNFCYDNKEHIDRSVGYIYDCLDGGCSN